MTLVVECKADEALAQALGLARRDIVHSPGKGRVCDRLSKSHDFTGMMDEDPGTTPPSYLQRLAPGNRKQGVAFLTDSERNNRVVILCPRLEEWLVASAKESSLKMTDFGFGSDSGFQLHGEINERLAGVGQLVAELLRLKNDRMLYVQSLLMHR